MTKIDMLLTKQVMVAIPKVNRPLPDKLKAWIDTTKFHVEFTENIEQELARSLLVSKMYNLNYDYIFFVDSDMTPENIDLDETIGIFYRRNLPVVSCITSSRGPQHKLLLFKKHPTATYPSLDEKIYKKDELIEVYAIGFGACLINKNVFDTIGLPWFRTNWQYIIPETQDVRIVGGTGMGADFFFSLRCQEEKIPLYVDCSQLLHHQELNRTCHFYNHKYPDEVKMKQYNMLEEVNADV